MATQKPQPFTFTLPRLKALKTADKAYEVADRGQPGLSCRVLPSGIKTLQVHKRPKGSSNLARIKICKVGEFPLDTPDGARSKARKILSQLEQGINPNKVAKQTKADEKGRNSTLRYWLDLRTSDNYVIQPDDDPKKVGKIKIAPRTAQGYKQTIEKHLHDWLDKPIESITPDMLETRCRQVQKTHYSAANNIIRRFGAVYKFAAKQLKKQARKSVLPDNPASRDYMDDIFVLEKPRQGHIDSKRIAAWWEATEQLPDYFPDDGDIGRDYLQFILLSGLRRDEARNKLTWDQVDLKKATFVIPDTKNREDLELPITHYMMTILKRRWQFDKDRPFPLKAVQRFYVKIEEIMKDDRVTIHDLRRTFITFVESLDISQYSIKALVNHTLPKGDVTAQYIQMNAERLRKPLQQYNDQILGLAGVNESNVVKLA